MYHSETGELALSISPVSPADEGYYTCQITTESGQCYCEAPLFIDGEFFLLHENCRTVFHTARSIPCTWRPLLQAARSSLINLYLLVKRNCLFLFHVLPFIAWKNCTEKFCHER